MKNRIKTGDRVVVYEAGGRYVGTVQGEEYPLVEVKMKYEGLDNVMMFVHHKQCRRLKTKTVH